MPVQCPRCQTVNPDGNAFCQNCGQQLTAAAGVAGPPQQPVVQQPVMQPGMPPASPYIQAPVQYAPMHKSNGMALIGAALVALLLLGGGGAAAWHFLGANQPTPQPSPVLPSPIASPTPPQASPSPQPQTSPSPAESPSPQPSPSPQVSPSPGPLANGICSTTNTVCVPVPSGWKSGAKDVYAFVISPDNAEVAALANHLKTPSDAKTIAADNIKSRAQQNPDLNDCNGGTSIKLTDVGFAGKNGVGYMICYTDTQNGNQPTAEIDLVATSADGSIVYLIAIFDTQSHISAFIKDATTGQVMNSVQFNI